MGWIINLKKRQLTDQTRQGDTIIEVLFAIAVFSFIAITAMQVMNQGMISAQLSLEISLVRNQINAQAEALRFINSAAQSRERDQEAGASSYAGIWSDITKKAEDGDVSSWDDVVERGSDRLKCRKLDSLTNAFVINTKTATSLLSMSDDSIVPAPVYARLVYDEDDTNNIKINSGLIRSEGLWIEASVVSDHAVSGMGQSKAYDFHIRACWDTPGRLSPMKLGTIVRLHDPVIKGFN